jgi:hypothetical protein
MRRLMAILIVLAWPAALAAAPNPKIPEPASAFVAACKSKPGANVCTYTMLYTDSDNLLMQMKLTNPSPGYVPDCMPWPKDKAARLAAIPKFTRAVVTWLVGHPDMLSLQTEIGVQRAMAAMWPCKK